MSDPYQPPLSELDTSLESLEDTRAELLNHESLCVSMGWLLVSLSLFVGAILTRAGFHSDSLVDVLLYPLWVLPSLVAGLGLLRQRAWGRVLSAPMFLVFMLLFPIGTFLGGYGLWILFSERGSGLFAASYQEAKEATPQLRPSAAPSLVMLLAVAALATVTLLI